MRLASALRGATSCTPLHRFLFRSRCSPLLRYLQTLTEIGAEQNSTIIFPMPIDIIKPFLDLQEKAGKAAGTNGDARISPVKDIPLSA